jgi:hypothetical protein
MRIHLLFTLTACFCFAACAEHSGDMLVRSDTPETPINQPDNGGATTPPPTEAPTVPVNNSGGEPGGSPETPGGGGGAGGGTPPSGGGPPGGGSGAGIENPGNGTEGSQPVPEPSTLLLVGTGLAAAGLLRRRRQEKPKAEG